MYPVLIQIQYIVVHTYGVFLALALLGFLFGSKYFLKYTKQPLEFLQKHFLWLCASFILVAKLSYIFFHLQEFSQRIWFFLAGSFSFNQFFQVTGYILSSGYYIGGGLIGALVYLYFASRADQQSFHRWSDIMTLGVLCALLVGLVGSFLGGYYYGTPSTLPWALTFESSVHTPVKYLTPIHPLQLYGSLFTLLLLVGASKLFHTLKIPGLTTTAVLLLGPIGFFLLEYLRGDVMHIGIFTANQVFLLVLFVIGLTKGITLFGKYRR